MISAMGCDATNLMSLIECCLAVNIRCAVLFRRQVYGNKMTGPLPPSWSKMRALAHL